MENGEHLGSVRKEEESKWLFINCLNACDDILAELRYRRKNYFVSEAATQLQSFKQIGSHQSHRRTIWGRIVVFQTRAVSGTRTEEILIILLLAMWIQSICAFVYVLDFFKLFSTPFCMPLFLSDTTSNGELLVS